MAVRNRATKRFDLVVFGEFFSDLIFYGLSHEPRLGEEVKTRSFLIAPGGGLATSAVAAKRLGSRTAVITRVGGDASTLPTWAEILHEGLDVSACEVKKGKPTALTVSAAYRSNRMMLTHDPINEHIEELLSKKLVLDTLHRARHVHFACPLRKPARWIPVMEGLRDAGITVSANFGWNPDLSAKELLSIVKHCEFIFPSEHEAKAITGSRNALDAIAKLVEWCHIPVVKLARGGALLEANGKRYRQTAPSLPVIDATGASDAFDGGFLHAFLQGAGWDECLQTGNICSSLCAAQPGGLKGLPTHRELRLSLQTGLHARGRVI